MITASRRCFIVLSTSVREMVTVLVWLDTFPDK